MKTLLKNLLFVTVCYTLIFSNCHKDPAPKPQFTITFNLNGGTGLVENQTKEEGTTIILPSSSSTTFYYSGYNFVAWNTKQDGSGQSYSAGSSYTVSANITLYAIWQQVVNYTITFNLNGGSGTLNPATVLAGSATILPTSSANTFYFTDYTFVSWNTKSDGTGVSYLAGSSYTPMSNTTLYAIWKLNFTAVFTATDASTSAIDKSIAANSVVKAFKINVTTAGPAKLETFGTMTNGNNAIAYYWITSKDSSELFQSTSTLNPVIAKTAASISQTINLPLGTYIVCFKTASYSGAIASGMQIGLKLTGANGSVSNNSYTANGSLSATPVVKINLKFVNNVVVLSNVQNNGSGFFICTVVPCSDEAGSVYDGSLYPSIYSISFDTKDTRYFSTTTGYDAVSLQSPPVSNQNFNFKQYNGTGSALLDIFTNSQATLSSNILGFVSATAVQFVKSNLGNFAYCSQGMSMYGGSTTFGPASVCWPIKSMRLLANPEIWVYDPNGVRIF